MKTLFSIIFILFMSQLTQSFAYDSIFNTDKVNTMIKDTYVIETTVTFNYIFSNGDVGKIEEEIVQGIGFYIGDGYYLALTHATIIEEELLFTIMGEKYTIDRKISKGVFKINNKEIQLIGRYDDISLFRDKNVDKKSSFKFGDTNLLTLGTKCFMIGNPAMEGIKIKNGIISQIDMSEQIEESIDKRNSFIITNITIPGDSGAPLLAQNGEDYYLIGVVYARIQGEMGVVFDINYIKVVLKILTHDYYFEPNKGK